MVGRDDFHITVSIVRTAKFFSKGKFRAVHLCLSTGA